MVFACCFGGCFFLVLENVPKFNFAQTHFFQFSFHSRNVCIHFMDMLEPFLDRRKDLQRTFLVRTRLCGNQDSCDVDV